ncbi:MAG: beta-ketoacyl synthase N-terminal-like domain-containing protein, partial [Pseudomonadota bacterium]
MNGRRVAVTGLGLVTSVGRDVATTWAAIQDGRSGAALISAFDVSAYSTRFSASVRDFDGDTYFSPKEMRKMDVFVQYGMAAGIQAFEDSGYEV